MNITPLTQADRPRWTELWRQYLDFYSTVLPDAVYDHSWARLMDDVVLHGFAARDGGQIVGIVHFLEHPSAWTLAPVVYLQDLFTDPAYRGRGIARARQNGNPRLYWLTQSHNTTARQLYDKLAKHTGFIRYEHPL